MYLHLAQSLRGGVAFFALFTIVMQIQNCLKYYSYAICYFSDLNRKYIQKHVSKEKFFEVWLISNSRNTKVLKGTP